MAEKALEVFRLRPCYVSIWRILLGACKLHGNVVLAEIAKNKLLKLDPCNSGNYVLSSSSYAGVERWDDAKKMREQMEGDVKKPSGWSSMEPNTVTSSNSGMVVGAS
ncbi:hypothetical protein Acr_03g0000250 [Actinidia rufa]|uniref:Tetratricopeptide repeat (TPR)-like superfamily protein n=1 Tax=Actinidia rufa TaxID=165716 RepID=A0A7J0E9S3_9ERIC|nr:hypothetical protein Acr_03g0000250 [Actinidia rufa]